ncbi:DUF3426 domain-containing protein [Achromobacter agilis]|uniref:Zinc finger/thioredoxin putative domain-containing protein n=1 Tax=Achromobacter agilis TaxID=1353888 RepID=A0A446CR11_9BURK|nr:DUF3426 domain-containing protein [Achromobacter agilis]SSW70280.1 hypothetical protein AGI3411_04584 [Achromobacter agilis]
MALTTRCPQCGTSFKVVPDQLRVRNGLVRCGACSTVFDGRACLLPESGAAASHLPAEPVARPAASAVPPWEDEPEAPVDAAPAYRPPVVAPSHPPVAPAAAQPAVLRGRDDIRRRTEPDAGQPEEADDEYEPDDDANDRAEPARWARSAEPAFAPAGDYRHVDVRDDARDDEYDDEYAPEHDDPREPVLGDTRTRYSSATDVGRAPPEFLDQDRQERRGLIRKLWGGACLAGLIVLGLQLLYVYRTDIANAVPALRPVLDAACRPLDCTVGYARRLERIAISSSSLQPPAGASAIDDGRSRLVLRLELRNRYDKPQHWPALVLDLTDLSDTVVVRRVLMPENYLTPEQLRGPFAPAGELKISVPIEVTGVQVNGYQIDKFFP